MKGDLSWLILQMLQLGIDTAHDISDWTIQHGKTGWYARRKGRHVQLPERPTFLKNAINQIELRQQFSCLLSKLKNQGLVAKGPGKKWLLSKAGLGKLKYFRGRIKIHYSLEVGDELKIIVFDIPEKLAVWRKWIRSVLKNLGFTMIQKSVWLGKNILPEEFIKDLRKNELIKFVEIFAITKSGTLKQIG